MKALILLFTLITTAGSLIAQEIGESIIYDINVPAAMKQQAVACPTGNESITDYSTDFERLMLALINRERRDKDLKPLKINPELTNSARYHAKDMCEKNYFSHNSANGCEPFDRIGAFYDIYTAGENIAAGYSSAEEAHQAFVASPPHYETMMNTTFREVGIGYWYDDAAEGFHRWVVNFGSRTLAYPVIINNDDYETINLEVELYVHGEDIFDEVRLKNDDDPWSGWKLFNKDTTLWEIKNIPGIRRVRVEMRTFAGASTAYEDEIYYKGSETTGLEVSNSVEVTSAIFPNPFMESGTIKIRSDRYEKVFVTVLNSLGGETIQIFSGYVSPGQEELISIDGSSLTPGIYFLEVAGQNFQNIQSFIKM